MEDWTLPLAHELQPSSTITYLKIPWENSMKTRSKATNTIDSTRMILTDSLSVPKTMGTGPMITAPPPLALPLPPFAPDRTIKIIAMNATAKPMRISTMPMLDRSWSAKGVSLLHF